MVLLQVIISGILLGGVYSLLGLGLSLLFGITRVTNFAHGEFIMIGMFSSLWFYKSFELDPLISVFVVIPISIVIGWILYKLVIGPIIGKGDLVAILTTLGLSTALQNLALMIFGPDQNGVKSALGSSSIQLGDISIGTTRLLIFVLSLLLVALVVFFLNKTYLGKSMKAVAQDERAAKYIGINVKNVYMLTFILSMVLTGIAGSMLTAIYPVYPSIGSYFILISFVVVVIGGLGNIYGLIPGAILIAVIESLSGYYLSTSSKEIMYFLVFLLVLYFKPAGLFGRPGSEEAA